MLLNNASERVTRDRFSSNHMSDDDVAGFSLALDDEFENDCLKTGRSVPLLSEKGEGPVRFHLVPEALLLRPVHLS